MASAHSITQDALNEQLFAAARAGNSARCTELILEAKADVAAEDVDDCDHERRALLHAVAHDHDDTVVALLDAKASVHIKDGCGWAALHWSACRGNVALCRLFVESHGADVNSQSYYYTSPLMNAAQYGHGAVCTYLLNSKANAAARDNGGLTALRNASDSSSDAVAAIRAWLKDREAAHAFARGTRHARRTLKQDDWTDSKLFDINLVDEITAFVTPRP
jgi:ankyrin repeat protein